jgi:hypothetical protein
MKGPPGAVIVAARRNDLKAQRWLDAAAEFCAAAAFCADAAFWAEAAF